MDAGRAFVKKKITRKLFAEYLDKRKRSDFCNFDYHSIAPVIKEIFNALNKARIEPSKMKLVKKSGVPDRFNCLANVDSNKSQVCFEAVIGKRIIAITLISPSPQKRFSVRQLHLQYTILHQCSLKRLVVAAEFSTAVKLGRL